MKTSFKTLYKYKNVRWRVFTTKSPKGLLYVPEHTYSPIQVKTKALFKIVFAERYLA